MPPPASRCGSTISRPASTIAGASSATGIEEYEVAAEELFENSWVEKVSVEDVAFAVDGLGEIELGGDDEVDVWFVPIRPGDYAFGVEGREEDDGFSGVMHVR